MSIDIERLKTDEAYWDEVAPEWADKVGVAYIAGDYWSHEFLSKTTAMIAPCNAEVRFIPRPAKPAAPEWNGTGYPPVGDEVECWDGEEWILGQSVGPYLGGWLCMLSTMERPFVGAEGDFRPLRTEEQREREELQEIISDAYESGVGVIAAEIIAAGWTREKQDD